MLSGMWVSCLKWNKRRVRLITVVLKLHIRNRACVICVRWTFILVISPGRGRGVYCDLRVCMSVCLSVRSHISKIICPNFTEFSVHATCGHGSILLWRQCNMLRISGLVMDNVMFSHKRVNTDTWQAVGELFTATRRVTLGSKSAIVDCLVVSCVCMTSAVQDWDDV